MIHLSERLFQRAASWEMINMIWSSPLNRLVWFCAFQNGDAVSFNVKDGVHLEFQCVSWISIWTDSDTLGWMTLREALQMNVDLVYSSIGFCCWFRVGIVAGLVDLTKPALFPALFWVLAAWNSHSSSLSWSALRGMPLLPPLQPHNTLHSVPQQPILLSQWGLRGDKGGWDCRMLQCFLLWAW